MAEAHIQVDTGLGFGGFLISEPEEILLVEDSLYSVRTAHQAGFGTAGVADTSAETERAAMEQTCDCFFETLADFDVPVTAPEHG